MTCVFFILCYFYDLFTSFYAIHVIADVWNLWQRMHLKIARVYTEDYLKFSDGFWGQFCLPSSKSKANVSSIFSRYRDLISGDFHGLWKRRKFLKDKNLSKLLSLSYKNNIGRRTCWFQYEISASQSPLIISIPQWFTSSF